MSDPVTYPNPTVLEIFRDLPGPIDRVWDYLTKSELRQKWLCAGDVSPEIGGPIVFDFDHTRLSARPTPESHERFEVAAAENGVRLDLAPPQRGRILDRFGRPLAAHRQAGRVSIVREQAADLPALMAKLGEELDISPERQARFIRDARRQASFQPVTVKSELSYEDFSRLSVLAPSLPGVQVEMASTRSYPRGRDFAHGLNVATMEAEKLYGSEATARSLRADLVSYESALVTAKKARRTFVQTLSGFEQEELVGVSTSLAAFDTSIKGASDAADKLADYAADRKSIEATS